MIIHRPDRTVTAPSWLRGSSAGARRSRSSLRRANAASAYATAPIGDGLTARREGVERLPAQRPHELRRVESDGFGHLDELDDVATTFTVLVLGHERRGRLSLAASSACVRAASVRISLTRCRNSAPLGPSAVATRPATTTGSAKPRISHIGILDRGARRCLSGRRRPARRAGRRPVTIDLGRVFGFRGRDVSRGMEADRLVAGLRPCGAGTRSADSTVAGVRMRYQSRLPQEPKSGAWSEHPRRARAACSSGRATGGGLRPIVPPYVNFAEMGNGCPELRLGPGVRSTPRENDALQDPARLSLWRWFVGGPWDCTWGRGGCRQLDQAGRRRVPGCDGSSFLALVRSL